MRFVDFGAYSINLPAIAPKLGHNWIVFAALACIHCPRELSTNSFGHSELQTAVKAAALRATAGEYIVAQPARIVNSWSSQTVGEREEHL